ncbi:MAG: sigma-70 family RNA polymerase sigma factor [Fimbriimonadaceae bacterium]|nr:sigma-70 family RNA polymerase sigma factor [Fimbriimonadaceae bacterium]
MPELDADPDQRAIARVLAGEKSAFRSLYERHYGRVYSVIRGIVRREVDAEDLTQDTFTLAFKGLRQFDQRSKFGTWLYRIAVNRALAHARRKSGRNDVDLTVIENTASVAPDVPQETDHKIEHALARMNSDDRALIILFYWEEQSLQEIANILDIGANAAKTRLFRARERFRQLYEGEPLEDGDFS